MKTLQNYGELALIRRLSKKQKKYSRDVLCGIGDDTAVLKTKQTLLWTTDMLIEGVHFTKRTPLRWVGQKAVNRNISDIAAMGGEPRWALVNLSLPKTTSLKQFDELNGAIFAACQKQGVEVVGGDLAENNKINIAITLLGTQRGRALLRSGAKSGDVIYVTGRLGGSLLGKHLQFEARVKEAQFLSQGQACTSLIDVSDGLLTDLKHILEASKKGAILDLSRIPISKDAQKYSRRTKKKVLFHALTDGEDYELLFTIRSKKARAFEKAWHQKFSLKLSAIGRITGNSQLCFENQKIKSSVEGFEHFS